MSGIKHKSKPSEGASRHLLARAIVGSVELLITGTAFIWLWTSQQGQHLWVWIAVGLPLFLAYVFVGGYVRHRMGLIKSR
jgi:hypothetical protein